MLARALLHSLPLIFVFLGVAQAQTISFYVNDEAGWKSAVAGQIGGVDVFDTTPTSLLAANQVASTPVVNTDMGSVLTFEPANSGLCGVLELNTVEPGATLIHDEPEFGSNPGLISIGDVDVYEFDSFAFDFQNATNQPYAMGFTIVSNDGDESGFGIERLQVSVQDGAHTDQLPGSSLPNGNVFVGVIADSPISEISFLEAGGADDIALRDFRLAPSSGDFDGDGLSDCDEVNVHGTSPTRADGDGDEMSDGFELANGFDPMDPDENANNIVDGWEDADADGLGNAAEDATRTDPNVPDTDGDGLNDGDEIGSGVFSSELIVLSTASGARDVVSADIDGDGDADLIHAAANDNTISWHENADGRGYFGFEHVVTSTESSVTRLDVADLDGDGDLDISSVGSTGRLVWFENTDGAGAFGTAQIISAALASPQSVFAADLDGDNDADLLVGNLSADEILWFENTDGLGTFALQPVITNLADGALEVMAIDIDGDGDLDVVGASVVDSEVAWYENTNGLGSFGPQQIITNSAFFPNAMVARDVDGDGDPDVISPAASSGIAWYENTNGLGAFGAEQVFTNAASSSNDLEAADVDGDGDVDILSATSGDSKIAWYDNTDAGGSFGPQQLISASALGAQAVITSDLDGDGDLDVASASFTDNKIAWYRQLNASNPLVADSDGDGLLDGAEVNTHGTDPLLLDSDGDGMNDDYELEMGFDPLDPDENSNFVLDGVDDFDSDGVGNGVEGFHGTNPALADTDSDGLNDFIEVSTIGAINAYTIAHAADTPHEAIAVDVDGDGDDDVVTVESSFFGGGNRIAWYELDPNNGQYVPPNIVTTDAAAAVSILAADFDGDGDADLLSSELGSLAWYENTDGLGSYGPRQVIAGSSNRAVAADFDGDGDLDILTATAATSTIGLHLNVDGQGMFGSQIVLSTLALGANSVFAADLDGDGDMDALSTSLSDSKVAWYENLGSATFGAQQVITTAVSSVRSVSAADFDADGDMDVLSASGSDDKVAWYANDGSGGFGPQQIITTAADDATVAIAVDLDGDGDVDVASASAGDNKVAWYENSDGLGNFAAQEVLSTDVNDPVSLAAIHANGDSAVDLVAASRLPNRFVILERLRRSDPGLVDSDGDGLSDQIEVATHGSNPASSDSDGDGLGDAFEITNGFDALDADEDLNGVPDGMDDADGDSLSNATEERAGTDPTDLDTDDDGLSDGDELGTENYAFGGTLFHVGGVNSAFRRPILADFDGDGDDDIVVSFGKTFIEQEGSVLYWSRNTDGDWTFSAPSLLVEHSNASIGVTRFAPVADVDSDGDADVVYVIQGVLVYWELNSDGLGGFSGALPSPTQFGEFGARYADLDGDGRNDALGDGSDLIWTLSATGAPGEFESTYTTFAFPGVRAVEPADFDGDGDIDLVAAGTSGLSWLENTDGLGSFVARPDLGPMTTWSDVHVADLDRDGDVDILASGDDGSGSQIYWFENTNGLGSFASPVVVATGFNPNLNRYINVIDVDGDGDMDLDLGIAWFENDGFENFGAARVTPDGVRADVDGDGDLDVVVTVTGRVDWYENLNLADPFDTDGDGDGLSDGDEVNIHGTDPSLADTDGDGLSDFDEVNTYGTDPTLADSDGDELFDGFEVTYGFDPLSPGDGQLDPDADGLDSLAEQSAGTDPTDSDTDDDGALDGQELSASAFGLAFVTTASVDADFGGIAGGDLLCQTEAANAGLALTHEYTAWLSTSSVNARDRVVDAAYYRTDGALIASSLADLTDGDIAAPINRTATQTFVGGAEVWTGTSEGGLSLADTSDTCGNWTRADSVTGTHGMANATTASWTNFTRNPCFLNMRLYCFRGLASDPFDPDTDGDGLLDGDESSTFGTDPARADTDRDGYSDGEEVAAGSNPLDDESVPGAPAVPFLPWPAQISLTALLVLSGARAMRGIGTGDRA